MLAVVAMREKREGEKGDKGRRGLTTCWTLTRTVGIAIGGWGGWVTEDILAEYGHAEKMTEISSHTRSVESCAGRRWDVLICIGNIS